ncbi:MAG TPA: helix-turn-helix domain-containing protein [Vicinamibacterales bacterium]|nr:helix-turn-helix domain-containing protein [Vicinamibacterales bacterium]
MKVKTESTDDVSLAKILEGAARCFATNGPRQTSITDIASASGVGRQTVYRRFKSREEIIEAVFQARVDALLSNALESQHLAADLEDQIIDTSLEWVERIKRDAVLRNLVESDSHETELFHIGPQSPLQSVAERIWRPLLERAKASGSLRPHLGIAEAVHYVRAIHYLLHVRDDLQERQRVAFVKNTLLTILIRDEHNKYLRNQ